MIKKKRGSEGLRNTASIIGISAPTLSRIEQGRVPDLETYLNLCDWLKVSTDFFIEEKSTNTKDIELPQNKVIAHLRADKTLDKEVSEALIKMINIAYKNV